MSPSTVKASLGKRSLCAMSTRAASREHSARPRRAEPGDGPRRLRAQIGERGKIGGVGEAGLGVERRGRIPAERAGEVGAGGGDRGGAGVDLGAGAGRGRLGGHDLGAGSVAGGEALGGDVGELGGLRGGLAGAGGEGLGAGQLDPANGHLAADLERDRVVVSAGDLDVGLGGGDVGAEGAEDRQGQVGDEDGARGLGGGGRA